ncbi:aromatic amino acid ammonia-lyase [Streptomyces sp. LP11]|uniref:Aromatic amino acid ammonia-lyase n=1 Tax=Streptomyces pyxinicus TaxID=2970331 RepID=A0ABT2B166_9ACTN|nr:aromatic amino acid ammonia-lyase [Streptomyces sp. LP11]MCS0602165.1 aromatic amino acid ammonia-lyase [Streptomyces sp. LP11]
MEPTTWVPPEPGDTHVARVVLDGTGLSLAGLVRLTDALAEPAVDPRALDRVRRARATADRLAATGRWYGRGTGVGAQRSVAVDAGEETAHGLRLLRSHAGGAGRPLPARTVRAMLAIRANQLLAAGSGIHPSFITALTDALRLRVHPAVHEYGAVGTGDLTALAQTGLTLLGERPWLGSGRGGSGGAAGCPGGDAWGAPDAGGAEQVGDGRGEGAGAQRMPRQLTWGPEGVARQAPTATATAAPAPAPTPVQGSNDIPPPSAGDLPAPVTPRPGDALALLSSNALTLGQAALAGHEVERLLRATHAVAALSLAAVSGSPEAYAEPVHALRPYPGPARAAAEVRRLLGLPDRPSAQGRRIQDPFGFRAFPQVHGAALEASDALRRIVETEINCPSENPVLTPDGHLYHHGGFFAVHLALALDALNLALLKTAQLSAARLSALYRTDLTGLPAFLATGPAGSSGAMILEYTANSALAELRAAAAAPASAGHAVLSQGLEEAAGFAGQAARGTERATAAYATVLACELVAAVRALRLHPAPPAVAAFGLAAAVLPSGTEDRPLTADIATATGLLRSLADL